MLNLIVDQYRNGKQNYVLVARCAPKSEVMFKMLQKIGFNHTGTGAEGFRGLGMLV
ncbi:protein of unknown function [Maridesulfovibrio hydrothermalis AM13 = DSM 14728]|uniref:Uncharacterized protein n=1 Tax=Maridesulfovibrio hydrothermalis AM13 = DSM 14728 TaxID=1121451 RepID=L0R9K6_9BACT|nr:protein of unknown function [Maridesulfovibrio hydrothermalis AM13 = DSM 14728]